MATDFSNKAVLGKPVFVGNNAKNDLPLDARTRIDTLDEIPMIEFPFVGMMFYVRDEDKFYVVKSLRGEEKIPGIAATMVPNFRVDQYEEFAGGSGEGMTPEEKAILVRLNETVGYEGVDSAPEYYLASDQYTTGALKVVSDTAVPLAGEVRISEANKAGGSFNVGDFVLLVEATEAYEGDGLAEQVRINTRNIGESGIVAKPLHYEKVDKVYDKEVLQVVSDATDPLPDGCILKKDANKNALAGFAFKVGDRVRIMPEIPEVPESYRLATSSLEEGVIIVDDSATSVAANEVKLATANMNGGNFRVGETVVYRAATQPTKDEYVSCVLTSKDALIVVDSNKDPLAANEVKLSEVVAVNGQVEGSASFVVGSCVKLVPAKEATLAHFEYPATIWEAGTKTIIAGGEQFVEANEIKKTEVDIVSTGFNVGDKIVYVPFKATIPAYYVQDVGMYPEGSKLVVDNNKAVIAEDEIKLSDANMNGGNFIMGDHVVLVQGSEQVEGSGILWRLDLLEARNYDEIIGNDPIEGAEEVKDVFTLAEPQYPNGVLSVVANGTDPLESGCITQDTANLNQAVATAIPVGAKVIHIPEVIAAPAMYVECDPHDKDALTVVANSTENLLENQIKQETLVAIGSNFDIGQIVKFVDAVEGVVEHYEVVNKNFYGPDALEIVLDGTITKANQVELSTVYASGSTDPNGDPFDIGDMVTVVKGSPAVEELAGSGILGRLAALEKLHEGELGEPEEPVGEIVETIVNEAYPPGDHYIHGVDTIPAGDLIVIDVPAGLQYKWGVSLNAGTGCSPSFDDNNNVTQVRIFIGEDVKNSINCSVQLETPEGEKIDFVYEWKFSLNIYYGICDESIEELTADIIKSKDAKLVKSFEDLEVELKPNNQYDLIAYPSIYNALTSVSQNGFNILDSYDKKDLMIDEINYLLYCSKWKQTFPEGTKKIFKI